MATASSPVRPQTTAERDPVSAVPRPLGEQLARGGLLGLPVSALDALRGDGASGLKALAHGAVAGAVYTAVHQVFRLPPLGSRLLPFLIAATEHGSPVAQRLRREPRSRAHEVPNPRGQGPVRYSSELEPNPPTRRAVRHLHQCAAALSFSVLADSALEHYRGGFYNPAMFVAPTISAFTLATALSGTRKPRRVGGARRAVFGAAAITGIAGTGFHAYNILKREGGLSWLNLFYAAPLAAPMGITFAGLFGLAGAQLQRGPTRRPARLLGQPAGKTIALAAAAGLLGTAAEAGLLHFRGAFQNPFMYLPVTVPPLAALGLAVAALAPTRRRRAAARGLLWTTAGAGIAGMGFHAYGVHRNMGGWRNWSQNLLQGPPLPAPPSFTGMALAGLAGLALLPGARNE